MNEELECPWVTLAGVPLSFRPGDAHGWALTVGTQPYMRMFTLTRARTLKILERARGQFGDDASAATGTRTRDQQLPAGPIDFEIRSPGYPSLKVSGLYVVSVQPGADFNTLTVLVADRRWLWRRPLTIRKFNQRRRTGEFRLLNEEVVPIEVAPLTPDYAYKRTSLDSGQPYTGLRVLEETLREADGQGADLSKVQDALQAEVPPFEINGNGDVSVGRALQLVAGAQVFVDLDAVTRAISTIDNSERPIAQSARGRQLYAGDWTVVDKSLIRPRLVSSFAEILAELRFNSDTGATIEPGREPLTIENVMRVPDASLTLANGRTVQMGTWVTISDYLAAIALLDDAPAAAARWAPLTEKTIREHYLSGFFSLFKTFGESVLDVRNVTWLRRLSAILEHWRRTWRIRPQWMDKVGSVVAQRVAIMDQETGTPAAAQAFFDYMLRFSDWTLAKTSDESTKLATEITAYAANLGDAKVGPATVNMLDSSAGIFQLEYRTDLFGRSDQIAPGHFADPDEIPSFDPSAAEGIALWSQQIIEIAEDWNLSVVLSTTKDTPNDESRLHREDVTPEEARALLPEGTVIGECRGPTQEVYSGLELARYAWRDELSEEIESAWFDGTEYPRDLLINPDVVRGVAEAQAARVYLSSLDRTEGTFVVSLDPSIKPTGSISEVEHFVSYRIVNNNPVMLSLTKVTMHPLMQVPDVMTLLPESARRVLLRRIE